MRADREDLSAEVVWRGMDIRVKEKGAAREISIQSQSPLHTHRPIVERLRTCRQTPHHLLRGFTALLHVSNTKASHGWADGKPDPATRLRTGSTSDQRKPVVICIDQQTSTTSVYAEQVRDPLRYIANLIRCRIQAIGEIERT